MVMSPHVQIEYHTQLASKALLQAQAAPQMPMQPDLHQQNDEVIPILKSGTPGIDKKSMGINVSQGSMLPLGEDSYEPDDNQGAEANEATKSIRVLQRPQKSSENTISNPTDIAGSKRATPLHVIESVTLDQIDKNSQDEKWSK